MLELCIAKWWASLGTIDTSYSVTFHGIQVGTRELVIHGADSYKRVNISGVLGVEEVQSSI